MRPDIAFLTHDLTGTGVVRNSIRLANAAAALGRKTEYWVVHKDGALSGELDSRISVREIGAPAWLPRRIAGLAAVPRLARLINRIRPRILFSGGNHFHLTAGLAYRLAGSPKDIGYMGRASNAAAGRERLGFLAALLPSFDRLKYAGINPVIAVADELGRNLIAAGIAPDRIRVIPNGVNVPEAQRRGREGLDDDWFTPGAPPVIVGAGRISRQKNFDLLIEAFARARAQRDLRLIILGRGTPAAMARLNRQAQKLGVAEDVRLAGFVRNPFAYYARAACFVLTSRWEGMSNVLLEAMACGCPVVAVRAPTGTAELLEEGRIGPLVAADPSLLAHAILERIAAPRAEQALITKAQTHDLAQVLAQYDALIGEYLKSP